MQRIILSIHWEKKAQIPASFSILVHHYNSEPFFPNTGSSLFFSSKPNEGASYSTLVVWFFFPGFSGGDIIVSPYGNRTVTGTIVAFPDITSLPARFEVRLIPNRIVHIMLPTDATLTHTEGKGK